MNKPDTKPGRLTQTLIRMFVKHARVTQVETVAAGFRSIALESAAFKGVVWTPGQKLQVLMGSAFVARTFTPMEWDPVAGRTRFLGYAHGTGPASNWLRNLSPEDECDVFGPRASLDLGQAAGKRVLLGDETSIGLFGALARHAPGEPAHCLLEVDSVATATSVLAHFGLTRVALFERAENDAHLQEMEQRLPPLVADGATFVLTGKASSIQRLRHALRAQGVPASRLMTRAYWAPGKTGLD
ncbi:siderophore-interacting protein [Xanthomonas bundabergensis]|uniref:siderophore-interacting protein n=1 Tax=Xanthomonas bundabergensis TaxID=3160842 RepID=UPI0035111206